jgi:hypothetical protein
MQQQWTHLRLHGCRRRAGCKAQQLLTVTELRNAERAQLLVGHVTQIDEFIEACFV